MSDSAHSDHIEVVPLDDSGSEVPSSSVEMAIHDHHLEDIECLRARLSIFELCEKIDFLALRADLTQLAVCKADEHGSQISQQIYDAENALQTILSLQLDQADMSL